jgi:isopenicillin N synthase-like dioxygenase
MSNGEFRSVEHRAVIHPNKERISVAMFHCPSLNLKLCPLPEFVKKGEKVRYRSTSYEDFLKQYFAAKLDGTERLERLKFFFLWNLERLKLE